MKTLLTTVVLLTTLSLNGCVAVFPASLDHPDPNSRIMIAATNFTNTSAIDTTTAVMAVK